MKSNFKHCMLFCLSVIPFVACAEGDVPAVVSTVVPTVVTKVAPASAEKTCVMHCAFNKVVQFLKNHPFVTCATLVGLGVVAYVGYDLYKTAQEEQEEDEEFSSVLS